MISDIAMTRHKRKLLIFCITGSISFLLFLYMTVTGTFSVAENRPVVERSRFDNLQKRVQAALLGYLMKDVDRTNGNGDLYTISLKTRLLKRLHVSYSSDERVKRLVEALETGMFGWALKKHGSLGSLRSTYEGRGIVMTTNEKYALLALNCIKALRLIGCNYPIEIFFNGNTDLPQIWVDKFASLKEVKVIDISEVFELKPLNIDSWAIKSFALFASSFLEAILVDADAVILQNPMTLFDNHGYNQTGTLLFKDRTMFGYSSKNAKEWLDNLIPAGVSEPCKDTTIYQRKGNYQLKTGLMLMDKSRHFYGLLTACLLNGKGISDKMHAYVNGDKEMFWIGMELAGEPFYFEPSTTGSVGVPSVEEKTNRRQICGKLAHFDSEGRLLWFNDGLVVDKNKADWSLVEITHQVQEGSYDGFCLIGNVKEIDPDRSETIKHLKYAFKV